MAFALKDVKTFTPPMLVFVIMPALFARNAMPLLQMGTPEHFSLLRAHFLQSHFTEEILRKWFELKPDRPLDLTGLSTHPPLKRELNSSLDALIRLFVLGESLPAAEVMPLFPSEVWQALTHTALILSDGESSSRCLASVALYPIRDLFIASDRWTNPDHSIRQMFADIVYPALTKAVRQFIDYTSYAPCEDFLELCAGTAPAALLAARSAKNVWATDIAERSVDFAKFNAALNGIHNVTFAQGDLYQPVEGRTFDRIAAHPPYVPVLKPAEIFYGGGEIGEEITKRIIAELPGKLKPSGRLYCRTMGTEGPGHSFEARIREWLGEKHQDFDVALFVLQSLEPRQFALYETVSKSGGREQFAQWEKLFEKNEVRTLVVGIVVIQRIAKQRPAFTIRRELGSSAPAEALERAMHWETKMHLEGAEQRFFHTKLVATPGTEITVRHVLRDGEILPENITLSLKQPFATELRVQPWMTLLLPLCDGKTTVADLFEAAKQNDWIVPETPPEEFCRLLATLISGGFLQTEEFRLPAAAG
jgi:SAM-dependent methyltransferase